MSTLQRLSLRSRRRNLAQKGVDTAVSQWYHVPMNTKHTEPKKQAGYVLVCTTTTRQRGAPSYFRKWTGIGPATTSEFTEAATFSDERAAMSSPAYPFMWTNFQPFEADEMAIWDYFTEPGGSTP